MNERSIKKYSKLAFKIFLAASALLCVFLMRILRPFVLIRWAGLDISRIGATYKADWYLSERFAGLHQKGYFDIFYFIKTNNVVCNMQWLKMWQKVLHTVSFERFWRMVTKISEMLPGHQAHALPLRMYVVETAKTDDEKKKLGFVLNYKKPHISFTSEEELLGEEHLRELGIPDNRPFVCFHARDSAYLNTMFPKMAWEYHDYRDSSIHNYILAAENLIQKGYIAVRMGSIVKEKLNVQNPYIINYASNGQRTDFLDIYLSAKCEFFICSDTGIDVIPSCFRRPIIYTNWTPIHRIYPWVLNGLFIFKKFYSHKKKHLLTFSEIMKLQFGGPGTEKYFKEQEIDLRENTPEEIASVVMEMHARLNNAWEGADEDEVLQKRFWALLGPDRLRSPEARIGAEFLRQNQ